MSSASASSAFPTIVKTMLQSYCTWGIFILEGGVLFKTQECRKCEENILYQVKKKKWLKMFKVWGW